MTANEARTLKRGDRVWITYTPAPGHGNKINGPGTVEHAGQEVSKNLNGTEYTSVTVRWTTHASVFPSWCLAKLNK